MFMTEEVSVTKPSFLMSAKYRIAAALLTSSFVFVGLASAAINFTPISELLQAVVSLIPDLMDLVVGVAPLIVVIAIVGFLVKFLDRIIQMLQM
jgi:hypothetical protein